MPIYEMHCRACGRDFETLARITEETIPCVHCQSEDTYKHISSTHFRHADHWMRNMMGAMHKSQERDQLKKEMEKAVS